MTALVDLLARHGLSELLDASSRSVFGPGRSDMHLETCGTPSLNPGMFAQTNLRFDQFLAAPAKDRSCTCCSPERLMAAIDPSTTIVYIAEVEDLGQQLAGDSDERALLEQRLASAHARVMWCALQPTATAAVRAAGVALFERAAGPAYVARSAGNRLECHFKELLRRDYQISFDDETQMLVGWGAEASTARGAIETLWGLPCQAGSTVAVVPMWAFMFVRHHMFIDDDDDRSHGSAAAYPGPTLARIAAGLYDATSQGETRTIAGAVRLAELVTRSEQGRP